MTQPIRQPKVSELPPEIFDGVREGYVPGQQLRISPGLRLHREFTSDLDPITYEVIRHNLWNINEEHGATIQRISGSPVAMYALRPQSVHPHRGRRVRVLRSLHAVHVRRHRYPGQVDSRVPLGQSGHPRRRHVPRQRSLGRRRPSAGRDADLPGVLARASCSAGSPTACTSTTSAASRRAASARRPRATLRRRHPDAAAGQDRRGRRDPPRHRGALPAGLAQAGRRWRSTCARRSPAT